MTNEFVHSQCCLYIAKYILKVSEDDARIELNKLIEENIIEESKYAKDYYVIKNV